MHNSLQATFSFMSKNPSYFFEKYFYISFKLTQEKNPNIPINAINCSIGLHELPAIQEVIKHRGENRIKHTISYILQQIVRMQKSTSNTNTVTFPTSKVAFIFMIDLFKTNTIIHLNICLLFNATFILH